MKNLLQPGVMVKGSNDSTPYDRAYILGRFRCFFRVDGSKTAPADLTDTDGDGVPDFVVEQVQRLWEAHHVLTELAGLPDFFAEGMFAQQGLKYIDAVLDDIPVQRGLASAKVADTSPNFLRGSKYEGPSITIRLHRALPFKSLTSAHELFHIFQYACLPFLNMWFMEGTARHGQRWLDRKKPMTSALPQTQEELEDLLRKWHDAEFFWNRLAELCNPNLPGFEKKYESLSQACANPYLVGQQFLRVFFRNGIKQMKTMCSEMPGRNISEDGLWSHQEKRSGANNRYILRAICETVHEIAPPVNEELRGFIALVQELDNISPVVEASSKVQLFLKFVQQHDLAPVQTKAEGMLYCDAYDAATGTLSIPEIAFDAGCLRDADLDCFVVVRHIIGSLRITDQPQLTKLSGLSALVAIDGDLTIDRIGIREISEIFPRLERIKGSLQIRGNAELISLAGFANLISIDRSLEIIGNPLLKILMGFNCLSEIKKGTLRIKGSPKLNDIRAFRDIKILRSIEFNRLAIRNLDFLANFFELKKDFPGEIIITHCSLDQVKVLKSLQKIASSFYLNDNLLESLDGLDNISYIGASFSVANNMLRDLSHLRNLKNIEGALVISGNRLTSLDGLQSLVSLKTKKWGNAHLTISVARNPELRNFEVLKNIKVSGKFIHDLDWWNGDYILPIGPSPFYENDFSLRDYPGKDEHVSILCPIMGPEWTKNMSILKRFNVHSIDFTSIEYVIEYANKNQIKLIFATTVSAVRFILKNRSQLVQNGLRFITPSTVVVNRLVNKANFYKTMKHYGLDDFVPEVYTGKEHIKYPCVVKLPTGSGGKGQWIAENESDLEGHPSEAIYMEYVTGRTEFATNILIVREKIVYAQTFEKISSEEHYILGAGKQTYSKVPSRPVHSPILDIFEKVLCTLGCEGFYCIDYKIDQGRPKIFEINPRMGFTNTMFPALLEKSIDAYTAAAFAEHMDYIKECFDDNGFRYVVKRYEQCSAYEIEAFTEMAALARGSRPVNLPNIVRRCVYMTFAYQDNRIVGISGIKLVPESRAWEKAGCPEYREYYPYEFGFLYVDENLRRKGVSKELIRLSIDCVDGKKIFLVTNNPYVIDIYLKFGYLKVGKSYGSKNWLILRAPNEYLTFDHREDSLLPQSNKNKILLGKEFNKEKYAEMDLDGHIDLKRTGAEYDVRLLRGQPAILLFLEKIAISIGRFSAQHIENNGRKIIFFGNIQILDTSPSAQRILAELINMQGIDLVSTQGFQLPFLRAALRPPLNGPHFPIEESWNKCFGVIAKPGDIISVIKKDMSVTEEKYPFEVFNNDNIRN